MRSISQRMREGAVRLYSWLMVQLKSLQSVYASDSGQGTTEYAILVGVLVVIAILAIMVFRPKLQELWNAIAEGINGL